jgi:serine/threonine protein kinase
MGIESPLSLDAEEMAANWPLIVYLPLGIGDQSSIYLVRDERPGGAIYRLKRWHLPAPEGFLIRFEALRRRLDDHPVAGVVRPVAAYVDARGRPIVLSPFVQGLPIVELAASRAAEIPYAIEVLRGVSDVLRAAHDRDLAHGSITAGNIIADARSGTVHLLDFGTACLSGSSDPGTLFAADRRDLASLLGILRARLRGAIQAAPL